MRFLFFLFLFSFFLEIPSGYAEKIVFKEKVIFKIENTIFHYSDVIDLNLNIKKMICLIPSSLIMQTLDLQKLFVLKEDYDDNFFKNDEVSQHLLKLLQLEKLLFFLKKEKTSFDTINLKTTVPQNCELPSLEQFHKWPSILKELMILETFWNERFSKNNLRGQRGQLNSGINFIQTIDKQISHELFF